MFVNLNARIRLRDEIKIQDVALEPADWLKASDVRRGQHHMAHQIPTIHTTKTFQEDDELAACIYDSPSNIS